MKEKVFVGVDVSKEKLNIAVQREEEIKESEIVNSSKRIRSYFTKEKKKASELEKNLHVVFEATGVYHLFLAKTLGESEIDFSIINPVKSANYKKEISKRGKTDPVDTRAILSYAMLHRPEITKVKSLSQEQIASLLKGLEDHCEMVSAIRHRLEACNHNPYCHKLVIKSFHDVILTTKKEMEEIEKEIVRLVKETAPEEWDLLRGIKGVGKRMAAVTIAFFGDFSNFENCKQVVAFTGFDPISNQSGRFNGKTRISKQGNRYIRKILYMCSISASMYNGSCKELYDRLILKGKKKKQARVAVAHKLLRQIFAVVKYQRVWEENYKGNSSMRIA